MPILWKDKFVNVTRQITLTGAKSYWEKPVYYSSIEQTAKNKDTNLSGTAETREIARILFGYPEVTFVGFIEARIILFVAEGTNHQRVFEISQMVIDVIVKYSIYNS